MNKESENKDSKKIITIAAIILTLMLSVTSATYAYFAISATNTGTIQGTSANLSTDLVVTPVLPATSSTNTGVMVPQYSANGNKNALGQAITGGCVDANKNIACKVYKIAFQNKGTSGMTSVATLTLNSTMTNLKWYVLKTENNVTSVPASPTYGYPGSFTAAYGNAKTATALGTQSTTLDPNKYRYWYVVIWIEEKGNDQYSADGNKSFTGTVQVDATDSAGNVTGITSTFTGA